MVSESVELKNDLQELVRLQGFLSEFPGKCWMDERTLFHLNLVCDELITNIILYGYGKGEEGGHIIRVQVVCSEDWLELQIADDAVAFDPLSRPQPDITQDIEERGIGGLGIHFVRKVMDEVYYERVNQRNVLTMKKKRQEPNAEELA